MSRRQQTSAYPRVHWRDGSYSSLYIYGGVVIASSDMEDMIFGEICRCCMATKPRMKPLFDTNLFAMLNAITGLNVQENDGLPSQLCVPCVLQIRRSHFFKLQCESTDTALRSYVVDTKHIVADNSSTHATIERQVKTEPNSSSMAGQNSNGTEVETTVSNNEMQLKIYCQQCAKEFGTEKQLRRHMRRHFIDKPHGCNECGLSFLEKCNLNRHMLKHTGELRDSNAKPHLCSECGKSFKYATSLSRHKRFHAQRNLFDCQICSKSYVEQSSLDVHIRTHTNERPFLCSVCNKGFSQKANLERHERTHTGNFLREKPYSCDLCGKCFTQKSYLCVHKRIHLDEKPFGCPDCTMCFVSRNALLKHQQKPCSINPHRCNICKKTFRYKSKLRLHKRTEHMKNRTLQCPVCEIKFKQATQLTVHIKMNHAGAPIKGERDTNAAKDSSGKQQTSWSRQRTNQTESIDFDETYLDEEEGEEEEEEEEMELEEEDDEIDENVSILEDYDDGEEDTHPNEEYLVDALSNVGSIVEQENYEDFITEYAVVKEEPLLEISIMNPNEVSSDNEQ
ncbi:zinc finger protein 660-like [Anopheles marshallii]|uniref:zinc finger protein 660-like n=1 Tax=Anopheles marshallii TaxID=1521116 RepID=UPI00237AF645|nr:zinc finger protein 660-like [Anopheles marshallii]